MVPPAREAEVATGLRRHQPGAPERIAPAGVEQVVDPERERAGAGARPFGRRSEPTPPSRTTCPGVGQNSAGRAVASPSRTTTSAGGVSRRGGRDAALRPDARPAWLPRSSARRRGAHAQAGAVAAGMEGSGEPSGAAAARQVASQVHQPPGVGKKEARPSTPYQPSVRLLRAVDHVAAQPRVAHREPGGAVDLGCESDEPIDPHGVAGHLHPAAAPLPPQHRVDPHPALRLEIRNRRSRRRSWPGADRRSRAPRCWAGGRRGRAARSPSTRAEMGARTPSAPVTAANSRVRTSRSRSVSVLSSGTVRCVATNSRQHGDPPELDLVHREEGERSLHRGAGAGVAPLRPQVAPLCRSPRSHRGAAPRAAAPPPRWRPPAARSGCRRTRPLEFRLLEAHRRCRRGRPPLRRLGPHSTRRRSVRCSGAPRCTPRHRAAPGG
jgi:hypothetical protein